MNAVGNVVSVAWGTKGLHATRKRLINKMVRFMCSLLVQNLIRTNTPFCSEVGGQMIIVHMFYFAML